MSSLIAHAALPFVARRAVAIPPPLRRRFWITVVLCACAPDLDWLGAMFQLPATSLWAHRGLTHSLVAALVLALSAGLLGFRGLTWGSRLWWQVVAFLFAATAAHGLVDAMTFGDPGVALFAPFDRTRYFLPFQPLPVCPLGVDEYFSRWGLFTLLNELLYLLGPALLIATWIGAWAGDPDSRPETFKRLSLGAAVWGIAVVFLRTLAPEIAIPERPRILRDLAPDRNDPDSDDNPARIPLDLLPDQHLVTRLDDLRARHLFDRELVPSQPPWSSSFFPWWYGGEAGRWQESRAVLVARTLVGMQPPSEAEARRWFAAADAGQPEAIARLFTLAPTEKIDLANGDFAFPLTSATLERTHNGQPRYWYGRCNGIASAAMEQPEPFRVVEVIGREGQRLRFHPNDVKALLAAAYYRTSFVRLLGGRCGTVAFDSGAECSMNPGGLVLALANVLGLGGKSFMIDALPTPANRSRRGGEPDDSAGRAAPLGGRGDRAHARWAGDDPARRRDRADAQLHHPLLFARRRARPGLPRRHPL